MFKSILLRTVSFLIACPCAALAVPFQNGTFLDPSCQSGACDYPAGATAITGWTVSKGNIDIYGSQVWQAPPPGGNSIDLEGCCGGASLDGGMSQSFSTIAGHSYQVSFYMSGNPQGGYAIKTMKVTAGSYSGTFSYNIQQQGNNDSDMKYVTESFTFTAKSAQTTLNLASIDTQQIGWGPVIGGVSVTPNTPAGFSTLYSFSGVTDGSSPNGSLAINSAGKLLGTAFSGGAGKEGTIFSFNPQTNKLALLYSFNGQTDGVYPLGGLTLGAGGVVYGETQYGGAANDGTVFAFNTGTNQLSELYAFLGGSGGSSPGGGMVLDNQGNLDSTVNSGGGFNFGAIVQINATTGAEKMLYSFSGAGGGSSPVRLVLNSKNDIVGATHSGGSGNNAGELYVFNPVTEIKRVLYRFTGGADGKGPNGPLIADSKGNFYGTTNRGGASGFGTIFKFNTASAQLTTLYSFTNAADGGEPTGGLAFDGNSTLYGVTSQTNKTANLGTLFEFNLSSHTLTTLHSFTGGSDGGAPSNLTRDSAGVIYGTTRLGGVTSGFGTIYQYVP